MTLSELANMLGVSVATVSNAITGKGRMRDEKRREIIEKAIAAGYDITKAESRQRRKVVHIIVEHLSVYFCNDIVTGICRAAEQANIIPSIYNMNLLDKTNAVRPDSEITRNAAKKIIDQISPTTSGVIYVSEYPRDITDILPDPHFPLVYAYCYTKEASPCVNYDDAQGAYIAIEHMIQQGCKRIAMISGPFNSIPMTKRLTGYQRALLDGEIDFDPQLLRIGEWNDDNGYLHMKELLSSDLKPDGVFCQSDLIAIGSMRAIHEYGLRVPDDIAIVGFDNIEAGWLVTPKLTTVIPPCHEIGEKSFQILWDMINKRPIDDLNIKLPCRLDVRASSQRMQKTLGDDAEY